MAGTQVLVLGPVRVRRGAEELVPGGPRERGVLAAVALAGERGLDSDRLVDLVWGHDAPRTAHRTAQAYLSRLRNTVGADVLASAAGRHRLVAADVDLWEFERLLASARRSPATAPRDLTRALDLWRERAVACDAALDGAAELLHVWERNRLDARELSLAHLADEDVVASAEDLLNDAPHRERVWAALATAHYNMGHQGDALATIRRARHRLAEDLGIDLSPELEQLESDLLRNNVAPAPPPPLPEPTTRLVGRDDEVNGVLAALERSRMVTLVGTGGIGKTRVALAAVERLASGGSPVVVARLASATSDQAVRDALVEVLDPAVDLKEAARRRFGRVAGVLVIDNCEHVAATVAELVTTLLAQPLRLRVLATSRTPLGVAGEYIVDVPPLVAPALDGTASAAPWLTDRTGSGDVVDAPSAVKLFRDRAEEVTDVSSWDDAEQRAVAAICRALDGIPLALELTARRLRTLEVTELLDNLDTTVVDPVRSGDPRHSSMAAALEWSYRSLPEEQQAAFRRLGLLRGRLPLASAAGVAGDRRYVEDLLHASLLTRTALGVGMYEPVRQYAVSLLSADERAAGLIRIASEVATFAQHASRCLIGPDEVRWIDRLDAAHGDVRAVLDWAVAHGRDDFVVQIACDVGYMWLLDWSPAEGRRWLDAAMARVTDPAAHALLLVWSSSVAMRMGDIPLARLHGDAAIAEARTVDDPLLLGRALHARAMPDKTVADTGLARTCLNEAHALRLQGGDLGGAAMSLGALADIDVNEGKLDRAAEGYAIGLPLMRSAGTARGLVAYLHSMAELELSRANSAEADRLAQEAEQDARQTRDVWHVAQLLSVRCAAARDLRRPPEEQRELTRSALRAASAQPDPQILLDVVEHVAGHLVDSGRYQDAVRIFTSADGVRNREGHQPSVPRRARRDADEAKARLQSTLTPTDVNVGVDLAWLTAAAWDAVG